MKSNLNIRIDENYKTILDNIANENGFKSTSDFIRNNLYEIVEDYIDINDYKKIMKNIEDGKERTFSFDETRDLTI